MTTPYDTSDNNSLSFLIRTAFSNYEITMNKYEKLLVDNTTLTALIKEKLSQLPIESEIRQILQDLVAEADKRVQHQQDKLDTKESGNKVSTDKLIENLTKVVQDLIFRLKIVLAWLTVVSVVGSIAVGYINLFAKPVLKEKSIKEHTIDETSLQPHIDYLDKDGHKVTVPIILPVPTNNNISTKN